jgi:ribosomal protein S18 acetylase RimI-like enzyme
MAIMPLSIRRATHADAATVTEFNRLLALETEHKTLDLKVLRPGVDAALGDPSRAWYFLCEDQGDIIGQTMLTFEWSDWRNGWIWWIQSVYVRSDARRRGVFRLLFEHIRTLATQTPGVVGIRLYVERENTNAQQTYERLGLEKTAYLLMERVPL